MGITNLLGSLVGLPSKKGTKTAEIAQRLYEKNVELLREKRRIEVILDNISEGIVDTDSEFKIKLLNGAALLILLNNTTADDAFLQDKFFHEIFKFRTKQNKPVDFQTILAKKRYYGDDYLVLEQNGNKPKFIYLIISEVLTENNKVNYIISIRDVTVEKELERTKNDFVSVTSHELRTPMTIIKSYLWMLQNKKGGELNAKQLEYLDKAIRGADRMLALINDTLNISRIEQGRVELRIEALDLAAMINDVASEFKIKTDEKKIWMKTELDPKIKPVYADKQKLREIVINLVGNSLKFTTAGGITIKSELQPDTLVKTSIIDTGKGIEKDDLEKLFHKFGRLDNSYQTVAESGGTGLGLYIVKSLVETMGGRVGVTSEGKGKGSIFWFTLPTSPIANSGEKVMRLAEEK